MTMYSFTYMTDTFTYNLALVIAGKYSFVGVNEICSSLVMKK